MGWEKQQVHPLKRILAVTLACSLLIDGRLAHAFDHPAASMPSFVSVVNTNALMPRVVWLRNSTAHAQRANSNQLLRTLGWVGGAGAVAAGTASYLWTLAQETVQSVALPIIQHTSTLTISEPIVRVVQAGESLSGIFGYKNVQSIVNLNAHAYPGLVHNRDVIHVGDVLQTGGQILHQLPTMALPTSTGSFQMYAHPLIHDVVQNIMSFVQQGLTMLASSWHHVTQATTSPETMWLTASVLLVAAGTLLWSGLSEETQWKLKTKRAVLTFLSVGLISFQTVSAEQAASKALETPKTTTVLAMPSTMDPQQLLETARSNELQSQRAADADQDAQANVTNHTKHLMGSLFSELEKGPLAPQTQMFSAGPKLDLLFSIVFPGDQLKAAANRASDLDALRRQVKNADSLEARVMGVATAVLAMNSANDKLAGLETLNAMVRELSVADPDNLAIQNLAAEINRGMTDARYAAGQASDTAQDLAGVAIGTARIDLKTSGLTSDAAQTLLQALQKSTPAKAPLVDGDPKMAQAMLTALTAVQTSRANVQTGERKKIRAMAQADVDLGMTWQRLMQATVLPPGADAAYLLGMGNLSWKGVAKPKYKDEDSNLADAKKTLATSVNQSFLALHRFHQIFRYSHDTMTHASDAYDAAQKVATDATASVSDRLEADRVMFQNLTLDTDASLSEGKSEFVLSKLGFSPEELQASLSQPISDMTLADATHTIAMIQSEYAAYLEKAIKDYDDYLLRHPKSKKVRAQRDAMQNTLESIRTVVSAPLSDDAIKSLQDQIATTNAALKKSPKSKSLRATLARLNNQLTNGKSGITAESLVAQLDSTPATETPAVVTDELGTPMPTITTAMVDGTLTSDKEPAMPSFYARAAPSVAWTGSYNNQTPVPIYANYAAAAIGPGWTPQEYVTLTPTFNPGKMKEVKTNYEAAQKKAQDTLDAQKTNNTLANNAGAAIEHDSLAHDIDMLQTQLKAVAANSGLSLSERAQKANSLQARIAWMQNRQIVLEQEHGAQAVTFDAQGFPGGFEPSALFQADYQQVHLAQELFKLNKAQYVSLPNTLGAQGNVIKTYRLNSLFLTDVVDPSSLFKKIFSRHKKDANQDLSVRYSWLQAEQNLRDVMNGTRDAQQSAKVAKEYADLLYKHWTGARDFAARPNQLDADRLQAEAAADDAYDKFRTADIDRRLKGYSADLYQKTLNVYEVVFTGSDNDLKKIFKTDEDLQAAHAFHDRLAKVWSGDKKSETFDAEKSKYATDRATEQVKTAMQQLAPPIVSGINYHFAGFVTATPLVQNSQLSPGVGADIGFTLTPRKSSHRVEAQQKKALQEQDQAQAAATQATKALQAPRDAARASVVKELEILKQRVMDAVVKRGSLSSEDRATADNLMSSLDAALAAYGAQGISTDKTTLPISSVLSENHRLSRVNDFPAFEKAVASNPKTPTTAPPSALGSLPALTASAFLLNNPLMDAQTFFKTLTYGANVTSTAIDLLPPLKTRGIARVATNKNKKRKNQVALISSANATQMAIAVINHDQDLANSEQRRLRQDLLNLNVRLDYFGRGIIDAHELADTVIGSMGTIATFGEGWGRVGSGQVALSQMAGMDSGSFDLKMPDAKVVTLILEPPHRPLEPTLALSAAEINRRLRLNAAMVALTGSTGDRKSRQELVAFEKEMGTEQVDPEGYKTLLASLTSESGKVLNAPSSTGIEEQLNASLAQLHLAIALIKKDRKLEGGDALDYATLHPQMVSASWAQMGRPLLSAKEFAGVNWNNKLQDEWVEALASVSNVPNAFKKVTWTLLRMTETPEAHQAAEALVQDSGLPTSTALFRLASAQDRWANSLNLPMYKISDERLLAQVQVTRALLSMAGRVHDANGRPVNLINGQNQAFLDKALAQAERLFGYFESARYRKSAKVKPGIEQISAQVMSAISAMTAKDLEVPSKFTVATSEREILRAHLLAFVQKVQVISDKTAKNLAQLKTPIDTARALTPKRGSKPALLPKVIKTALPLLVLATMVGWPTSRAEAQVVAPQTPKVVHLSLDHSGMTDEEREKFRTEIRAAAQDLMKPDHTVTEYINAVRLELWNVRQAKTVTEKRLYTDKLFAVLFEYFANYATAEKDLRDTWNAKKIPSLLAIDSSDDAQALLPWKAVEPINWMAYDKFKQGYKPTSDESVLVRFDSMGIFDSFMIWVGGFFMAGWSLLRKILPSVSAPSRSTQTDLEEVEKAA